MPNARCRLRNAPSTWSCTLYRLYERMRFSQSLRRVSSRLRQSGCQGSCGQTGSRRGGQESVSKALSRNISVDASILTCFHVNVMCKLQSGLFVLPIFSRMRSEGFLFLSGGLGAGSCLTRFRGVCAERSRAFAACSHGRSYWALQFRRVASVSPRACAWTFRMEGVGNRGSMCAALDRGMAFRVAGVGNIG